MFSFSVQDGIRFLKREYKVSPNEADQLSELKIFFQSINRDVNLEDGNIITLLLEEDPINQDENNRLTLLQVICLVLKGINYLESIQLDQVLISGIKEDLARKINNYFDRSISNQTTQIPKVSFLVLFTKEIVDVLSSHHPFVSVVRSVEDFDRLKKLFSIERSHEELRVLLDGWVSFQSQNEVRKEKINRLKGDLGNDADAAIVLANLDKILEMDKYIQSIPKDTERYPMVQGLIESSYQDVFSSGLSSLKHRLSRLMFLQEFNEQLDILKTKRDELNARGSSWRYGNIELKREASDVLITALKKARDIFVHDVLECEDIEQTLSQRLEEFKKTCQEAITVAAPILSQHRGWKRVLGDLASFIAGLGVAVGAGLTMGGALIAGGVVAAAGHYFFFNQTDSAKKLKDCAKAIEKITPVANAEAPAI